MENFTAAELRSLDAITLSFFGSHNKALLNPDSPEFQQFYDVVSQAFKILGTDNRTRKNCHDELVLVACMAANATCRTDATTAPPVMPEDPAEPSTVHEVDRDDAVNPPAEEMGAMHQTTLDPDTSRAVSDPLETDVERAAPTGSPADGGLRDALVFAIHFLFTAAEIGATVGVWNLVRTMGGNDGPAREKTEWSAALLAGSTFPLVGELFKKVRLSLAWIIVVNPNVGYMVQGMEWVFGSLLASLELHAGINVGDAANRQFSGGERLPEWMFLGYFLTFGLMAVTDVLGARIFRGKLEIRRTGDQISQEYVLDELEMLVQELGQIISAPPEDAEWYEKMGRSMAALSGFTFSLRRFLKSGVWQIAGYRAYQTYTSHIVRTEGSAVEYNLTLEAADFIFFLSFRALLWVGGRVPDVGWTDVWNGLKFTYYSCRAIREG